MTTALIRPVKSFVEAQHGIADQVGLRFSPLGPVGIAHFPHSLKGFSKFLKGEFSARRNRLAVKFVGLPRSHVPNKVSA
jgi:hypothetical protein